MHDCGGRPAVAMAKEIDGANRARAPPIMPTVSSGVYGGRETRTDYGGKIRQPDKPG